MSPRRSVTPRWRRVILSDCTYPRFSGTLSRVWPTNGEGGTSPFESILISLSLYFSRTVSKSVALHGEGGTSLFESILMTMRLSIYFSRTVSKSVAKEKCDILVNDVCIIVCTHSHESISLLFQNHLEECGPGEVWRPDEWRLHHHLHTFSWVYLLTFQEQSRRVWPRRSVTPWWMTFASSFAHILMSLSLYFSRTVSKSCAQEKCDTLMNDVCIIICTHSHGSISLLF